MTLRSEVRKYLFSVCALLTSAFVSIIFTACINSGRLALALCFCVVYFFIMVADDILKGGE